MRIRIGQIGTGHAHAAGKMAAMRRSPDFEVGGGGEPDPRRRGQFTIGVNADPAFSVWNGRPRWTARSLCACR